MVAAPPPEPGLIEPRVEALIKASGIDFRIGADLANERDVVLKSVEHFQTEVGEEK